MKHRSWEKRRHRDRILGVLILVAVFAAMPFLRSLGN